MVRNKSMTLLVLKRCEILQLCIFVQGFPPFLHGVNETVS
jgi:hypothetical protein